MALALPIAIAPQCLSAPADAPANGAKTQAKPAAEKKEAAAAKTPEPVLENVVTVQPYEDLVLKPHEFLGKNVKFNANFFAFTSLALDYKPAFRSSKTHLSFLILRPGSNHLPLSELKLAMMIPKEKDPETNLLATLKDNDQVEIVGKVFSSALDDPWVEVFKLKKIGGSKDDDKKVANHDGDKKDAKEMPPDSDKSDSKSDAPGKTTK